MMIKYLFNISLSLFLISCSIDAQNNFIPSTQSYVSNTNLSTFYEDVQYGDVNIETIDIFIANPQSPGATPVVFNFHGGGFISGDKNNDYSNTDEITLIEGLLAQGISYVNINYQLLDTDEEEFGVIRSLESARGAIQYMIYYATEFNILPNNYILRGSSAGAGIAMYLGYAPIDEELFNDNPIKEISISPKAISLRIPQSTYDLLEWNNVFSFYNYDLQLDYNSNIPSQANLHRFYGIDDFAEMTTQPIIDYRSSVDMLSFISASGGVPTWLNSSNSFETQLTNNTLIDLLHNAYHGQAILNALNAQSTECIAYLNGLNYDDPSGETELNFIIRQTN